MSDRSAFRAALDLEPVGEGRFRAANVATGVGGVVFGGQLLAQTIVAAASVDPAKELKTVHTVFARGASPDRPLDIDVETMHVGRALASAAVTVRQGERLCTRSLCLLSAVEPDLIRHAEDAPPSGTPEEATGRGREGDFWEIRVVGGVDIADPEAVGPPELLVWSRFPGSDETGVIGQALLAYATDGFLIGTAMRPHPGDRAVDGPCVDLDQRAEPHPHLPRARRGRCLAPPGPPQPVCRPGPLLRPGRHLHRGRAPGGLLRPGQHDPRLRRGTGPGRRRPGQALTMADAQHALMTGDGREH